MATRSILPNSEPRILLPMPGKHGTFQVKWNEAQDSHVLYLGEIPIAAHHNGYSCYELAHRVIGAWEGKISPDRAMQQFDYIFKCGGQGIGRTLMRRYLRVGPSSNVPDEEAITRMTDRGRDAWADVPDATKWVDANRS